MKVCLVYYSKTGRTKRVVEYIASVLAEKRVIVKIFNVKPARDYYNRLLHLNPRVLLHTLTGKPVEITGDEDFKPDECDALVIATPIWYNQPAPPIYSFIRKYAGLAKPPVYCVTTSTLAIDYASRLGDLLKAMGYAVRECVSIVNPDREGYKLVKLTNKLYSSLAGVER